MLAHLKMVNNPFKWVYWQKQGKQQNPLDTESVQKQENDKIPCGPKNVTDSLTRGTEQPFRWSGNRKTTKIRCLDLAQFTY